MASEKNELTRIDPFFWLSLDRRGWTERDKVAYIDAVCYEVMIGQLPVEPKHIADVLKYDAEEFESIWEKIQVGFRQTESGHWFNRNRDVPTKPKKPISTAEIKTNEALNDAFYEFNVPETFREHIERWRKYKKERGSSYKPTGIRAFVRKLIDLSGGDTMTASKIIDRSISNNWQGIFPLQKNEGGGQEKKAETKKGKDELPVELQKQFDELLGGKQ